MPLFDVALPPAGIRFIWLGIADGVAGAGALAPGGGGVAGAGCAHTGTEIASAATAAAPIKRRLMSYTSPSEIEDTLYQTVAGVKTR
jgi:hypothetical protein